MLHQHYNRGDENKVGSLVAMERIASSTAAMRHVVTNNLISQITILRQSKEDLPASNEHSVQYRQGIHVPVCTWKLQPSVSKNHFENDPFCTNGSAKN